MAITGALGAAIAGKIVAAVAGQTAKVLENKLLTVCDECHKLKANLLAELPELEKVLKSTQESLVSQVSVPFDWLDNVQLCLYELEDMEDSEIPKWNMLAAKSILQTNLDNVIRLKKALENLRTRMRAKVPESQPSRPAHLTDVTSIRRDDKARIIQELNSDGSANTFGVSIVGICGAGKTVLARDVARDTSVEDHFRVIDPPPSANLKLEEVREFVNTVKKDVQPNKKVLILLDGLHSVKPGAWHSFRLHCEKVLPAEIKFLITTQNPIVAHTSGTSKHCLDPLSEADCFTLIEQLASSNNNLSVRDLLAITSYKKYLVDKCLCWPTE